MKADELMELSLSVDAVRLNSLCAWFNKPLHDQVAQLGSSYFVTTFAYRW